jgi:hypothetical protein
VVRRYNEAADELAKIASSRTTVPPDIFSIDLHKPSVDLRATEGVDSPSLDPTPEAEVPSTEANIMQIEGSTLPANLEPDWRTPYLDCLIQGELPLDKTDARQIARWVKTFVIYDDDKELYRRSTMGILQHCIIIQEGKNLLKDLHSGGFRSSCGVLNPRQKHILTGVLLANHGLRRY